MKDVGRLLTATEIRSADRYWHVRQTGPKSGIYPPQYKPLVVGIMWNMMAQVSLNIYINIYMYAYNDINIFLLIISLSFLISFKLGLVVPHTWLTVSNFYLSPQFRKEEMHMIGWSSSIHLLLKAVALLPIVKSKDGKFLFEALYF